MTSRMGSEVTDQPVIGGEPDRHPVEVEQGAVHVLNVASG